MTSTISISRRKSARTRVGGTVAVIATLCFLFSGETAVHADDCTAITSLPFVITTPGKYCLNSDLSFQDPGQSAITISAGNVLLDLQGFTMSGGGTGSSAIGTSGTHRSVTVRNGTVKGFTHAVRFGAFAFADTTSDSVVENIRLQDCLTTAIEINGNGNIVRNNHIVNTRGPNSAAGIMVDGSSNAILNNDIVDTIASGNNVASGIVLNPSERSIVENNRIERTVGEPGGANAIFVGSSSNVLVVNNRIIRADSGIVYLNSSGVFRDNIAVGCTTKYSGGTNGGNNQ
jgi:parallel beta-helix repeat protein